MNDISQPRGILLGGINNILLSSSIISTILILYKYSIDNRDTRKRVKPNSIQESDLAAVRNIARTI